MHPPEYNIVVVGACPWDNNGTGMYSFHSVDARLVSSHWQIGACLMIVILSGLTLVFALPLLVAIVTLKFEVVRSPCPSNTMHPSMYGGLVLAL